MPVQNYIDYLEQLNPLSIGLKTYLKMSLTEHKFIVGEKILLKDSGIYSMPFLVSGCVRVGATDHESEKETTLFFFYAGEFIMPLPHFSQAASFDIFVEFLAAAEVLDFESKHNKVLFKIFPEMLTISKKLHTIQYSAFMAHLEKRNILKGEQHYLELITAHPELLGFCRLEYLASFLGLEANSLSHIRSRLLKR